jgi:uncharacterized SAM-binding protein YcdF (DUF218 family)
VVFLFFSNSYIINNIWNLYQAQPVRLSKQESFDAGIVLGGISGFDTTINQGFFGASADRFIQTARLYHEGHIKKVVVSGGNAILLNKTDYSEANFLAENLGDVDIPDSVIIRETRSRNTKENAAYSKQLLDSANLGQPFLLITSAHHMPRALKIFRKNGMEVKPFPCNYMVLPVDTRFTWKSLLPSEDALSKWTLLLKEWVGLLVI